MEKYPDPWPHLSPIYDIQKSYLENLEKGPFFSEKRPHRVMPPKESWVDFLGFKLAAPLGVPAGPLLNSNWVKFAFEMGFDLVTYKTIRSKEHPAHPVPNMVYVKGDRFLDPSEEGQPIALASSPPTSMEELSLTNSFGIPSKDPAYLIEDIARAHQCVKPGQALIVSVVGTPREGEDFFYDFVKAALIAIEGGAKIIELDLSCPNVTSPEGSLHSDPKAIFEISKEVRKAIGDRPLILKLGMIRDKERLSAVLREAARGGAQAICGINTLSMRVVDQKGESALGPKRIRSGVCGKPIREAALHFIRIARHIIDTEKLDLALMGTGGVTHPSHFDLFFEAGAEVAMTALGMMWDPYLALRYFQKGVTP